MKKYSKKVKDSIVKSLEGGNKILATCKAAGVNYTTYLDWIDENSPRFDSDFSNAVKNALEQGVKVIEEICIDTILKVATRDKKEVWTAAAWMLERTLPMKYGVRQEIKHSGEIKQGPDLSQFTEEEKQVLLKIARRNEHIQD
jgi:hypothetical protein